MKHHLSGELLKFRTTRSPFVANRASVPSATSPRTRLAKLRHSRSF